MFRLLSRIGVASSPSPSLPEAERRARSSLPLDKNEKGLGRAQARSCSEARPIYGLPLPSFLLVFSSPAAHAVAHWLHLDVPNGLEGVSEGYTSLVKRAQSNRLREIGRTLLKTLMGSPEKQLS